MYAEFFGLRELPFNNTPDPRFFFSTPDHDEALASLVYAVKERKGFVLLTGEVGAGKTLVSRLMLKHFGCTITFAHVNHAIHSSADLMESLCAEFELPHEPGSTNTQLVRTLHDFLLARFAQNLPVVLVLDEAQNLPIEAFEQLRMIGNLEADDAKLLQIAIVGQPELQSVFQSPALRQLRQRIFRSFHLPALDRKSTEAYIRHRLTVAGAKGTNIFSSDAIDSIHQASRGLPRLINTICDNAMLSGYSADRMDLDRAFIESVVSQMILPLVSSAGASRAQPLSSSFARSTVRSQGPARTGRIMPALPASDAPHSESSATGQWALDSAYDVAEWRVRNLEHMTERADGACDRANAIVVRIEEAIERSVQSENQLASCEERVERLVRTVRAAAAELEPLLADLRKAAENGQYVHRAAQGVHDRLVHKIEASRVVLDEFKQASLRMSRRAVRVVEPGSLSNSSTWNNGSSEVAASFIEPRTEESVKRLFPRLERMFHGTRESLADLRELVRRTPNGTSVSSRAHSEDAFADATGHDAPGIRLVRRMESLVQLVDRSVSI